jgi:hypothetical protein
MLYGMICQEAVEVISSDNSDDSDFKVSGLGFRVWGLWFRVWG